METLQLTKAEQRLINRINEKGGLKKYESWVCYSMVDGRKRFKYHKNVEKLKNKLTANNALHLLKK